MPRGPRRYAAGRARRKNAGANLLAVHSDRGQPIAQADRQADRQSDRQRAHRAGAPHVLAALASDRATHIGDLVRDDERTMEKPSFGGSDAVDLAGAGVVLAANRAVRRLLKATFGQPQLRRALQLLRAGRFEEGLGADIHGLLSDAIVNESVPVWTGSLGDGPEAFPVEVAGWGGVFFVTSPEYDKFGYFLSVDDAVSFIHLNWDDVTDP
jgi:hypothetical protein